MWFDLHEAGCQKLSGSKWTFARVQSPFWRLYWADRAGSWVECSGRRFQLEPSRLLLLPAHLIFNTHGAERPVTHFWIHFSLFPDVTAMENLPLVLTCRKEFRVASVARETHDSVGIRTPRLFHVCHALLHQVFAHSKVNEGQRQLPSKLRRLLDSIESSMNNPPAVDDLARQMSMSRGGFIRWFRKTMETSPARYVMQRRINHACRMLKFSTMTIEEISEALGFTNRNHFSRMFQRQIGLGPASFRRN